MNQKECSEDRLQGNGGPPSTNASTKTHVAYYHNFNTVIGKVPSTVPEANMNQERKKVLMEDDCRQITGYVILCAC